MRNNLETREHSSPVSSPEEDTTSDDPSSLCEYKIPECMLPNQTKHIVIVMNPIGNKVRGKLTVTFDILLVMSSTFQYRVVKIQSTILNSNNYQTFIWKHERKRQ